MNSLKILTLNTGLLEIDALLLRKINLVSEKETRVNALIHVLREHPYNIVMLQEISGSIQKRVIKELNDIFPYHATHSSYRLFSSNLLILSRLPLSNIRFISFNHQTRFEAFGIQKGFLCADATWNNETYHFITTHLVASGISQYTRSSRVRRIRGTQINQLTEYIKTNYQDDSTIILGGDFNAGPHSSQDNYKLLSAELYDCMQHLQEAERITWHPENPLARNEIIKDPMQQVDGFYMRPDHHEKIKLLVHLSRKYTQEISLVHAAGHSINTMLSDHYGVEMEIKKPHSIE